MSLLNAVNHGNLELVRTLLQNGADVNQVDNYGDTPLIIASNRGYLDIVNVLIQKNANVNYTNIRCGSTALFWAVHMGKSDIVNVLIQNGAKVNQADIRGDTPLLLASKRGYPDIVKILLQNGAIVNLNINLYTPSPFLGLRVNSFILRLLIKYGAFYRLRDVAQYYPEFKELYRISLTFNFSRTFDGSDELYEERAREENQKQGLYSYAFQLVDSLIKDLRIRLPNKGEEGYVPNMAHNFPAFLRFLKSQMDVLNTNPPR